MKRRITTPPALVAKVHRVRGDWSPVDRYVTGKTDGHTIFSTLDGDSPGERARQVRQLLALRPRLRHGLDHWMLSLHPDLGQLSDSRWRRIAKDWLEVLGYGAEAAALAARHRDTPHDHIHVIASRVRADGSVVSESNLRWRALAAAAALARKHGLAQVAPRMAAGKRSQRVARAKRRAARRGGLAVDVLALAAAVRAAVEASTSLVELRLRLAAAGIEARPGQRSGPRVLGWSLRFRGSEEWTSGGSLGDDLTLPQVVRRVRAQRSVDSPSAAPSATDRVPGQPIPDDNIPPQGEQHDAEPRLRERP